MIDKGPNGPLSNTGRAYFGGYITGDVDGSAASAVTAVWFKTARSPAQNANNFFMGKPPCNQLL